MMIQRSNALRGFAASVAVVLLAANAARADITWILQNTSALNFSGQVGSVNNNNTIVELYNFVPQTDNNTTLFPGFTNGLQTYSAGTMTSVGNNFLSSLNFGNEPDVNNVSLTTAQTVVQNSGDWLPNPVDGSFPPFDYGTPIQQNIGGALAPVPGYTNNADGGRGSISTGYGTFSNGTGDKDPVTGLHAAQPMAVGADGHFNAQTMAITGQFNLNVSLNLTSSQGAFSLNEIGTASPPDNLNPDGFITRGTGPNSGDYVIHIPLPAFQDSGTLGSLYYNLNLVYQIVAKANIAPGDGNFDGIVNGQDLAAVSSNWLATNAAKLGSGDVNGDGIVNGQDLALISSNWLHTTPAVPANVQAPVPGGGTPGDVGGPPGPAQAVPEPSTWLLLGLGSLGLLWKRRRG